MSLYSSIFADSLPEMPPNLKGTEVAQRCICNCSYLIHLLRWMAVMTESTLYHDQQVAAGEHVRIWQSEDGNLFEHVYPTGHSITIWCKTLDEARSLMAQSIPDVTEVDGFATVERSVYQEGIQTHERF